VLLSLFIYIKIRLAIFKFSAIQFLTRLTSTYPSSHVECKPLQSTYVISRRIYSLKDCRFFMSKESQKFNRFSLRFFSVEVDARSRGSFESATLYHASIKSSKACWLHASFGQHNRVPAASRSLKTVSFITRLKNIHCTTVSKLFLFSSFF